MRAGAIAVSGMALLLAGCASVRAPQLANSDTDGVLSRQILVTARQTNSGAEGLVGDPATLYLRRPGYGATPRVDRLLDEIGREYGLERVDGWLISSLGVYCEVYELTAGSDLDEVLSLIGSDPRIESAQAMNVYQTEGVRYNDPYASIQPAIGMLSIDAAHEHATGRGVTVAVIDSLVDDRHPEIRGRVSVRRDLAREYKTFGRAEIHGTAVAGVIASTANNGLGIVGIAPDASVVSLRACWTVDESSGSAMCSSFSVTRSLEIAIQLGVDIVNMSLSGPQDPLIERLIDAAIENGVIIVAAASDGDDAAREFPASHPAVIAATSSSAIDSFVPNMLGAPGDEVISTVPGSEYAFFSGNSMASAFVSGVSALLVEQRPEIDGEEVLRLLSESSTSGVINACLAVAGTTACPPAAGASLALESAD